MRNLVIVSFGQEVARVSYDTKGGAPKATTYEPIEGETNRASCLAIVIHTLNQLKDAEIKDNVAIYTLGLIKNTVIRLENTKRTLLSLDITDKESVLKAFLEGLNTSDAEKELWDQFYDLHESMTNVRYVNVPKKADVDKMSKSLSGFERNLAKAIVTAWGRLPQLEMEEMQEDEAI